MKKLKIVQWLNIKNGQRFFGLKIKVGTDWHFVSENEKPLFFDTYSKAKKAKEEMYAEIFLSAVAAEGKPPQSGV